MHNQCPKEVLSFLWDLFKYSDNQINKVGEEAKKQGGGRRPRNKVGGGGQETPHKTVQQYYAPWSLLPPIIEGVRARVSQPSIYNSCRFVL